MSIGELYKNKSEIWTMSAAKVKVGIEYSFFKTAKVILFRMSPTKS
ncbi:hypothetical protein QG37_06007 [Candidozyma auris]|nr:hypothetical protein QG37_06007 [[Candida] auris]